MRSRQNLLKHDPEREQIATAVDDLTLELLRRHVARRSRDASTKGTERLGLTAAPLRAELPRQPEVHDFHVPVPAQHHVSRLQVPVDDAPLVRLFERLRDLHAHAQSVDNRWPLPRQSAGECLAFDILHRDKGPAVFGLASVIDFAYERMVEGGRGLRFTLKASKGRARRTWIRGRLHLPTTGCAKGTRCSVAYSVWTKFRWEVRRQRHLV